MIQYLQIIASAAVLSVLTHTIYKHFANRYNQTELDKYGRRHVRNIRTGRFVKAN